MSNDICHAYPKIKQKLGVVFLFLYSLMFCNDSWSHCATINYPKPVHTENKIFFKVQKQEKIGKIVGYFVYGPVFLVKIIEQTYLICKPLGGDSIQFHNPIK